MRWPGMARVVFHPDYGLITQVPDTTLWIQIAVVVVDPDE